MENPQPYRDQTILITGGAGAIGRNLTFSLAQSGAAKVIILDNLSASYEWNIPNLPNVLFVKGDITNDIDFADKLRKVQSQIREIGRK